MLNPPYVCSLILKVTSNPFDVNHLLVTFLLCMVGLYPHYRHESPYRCLCFTLKSLKSIFCWLNLYLWCLNPCLCWLSPHMGYVWKWGRTQNNYFVRPYGTNETMGWLVKCLNPYSSWLNHHLSWLNNIYHC